MSISGSGSSDGDSSLECLHASPAPGHAMITESGQGPPPVLDRTILADLEEDFDSPAVARSFAQDYIGLWKQRLDRLTFAVNSDDREAALDAGLSLKNSSAMVGAVRLSVLAVKLLQIIQCGDMPSARNLLPVVAEQGDETIRAIQHDYLSDDR